MIASLLPDRLPWYLAGPALGLLVTGLFVVANQPLGASGAYVQTANFLSRRESVRWRVFYFAGIALGGFVAAALKGGPIGRAGYEALRAHWSVGVVVVVVFAAAVLMGYGARMSGGCTSGHGICGTAQRSPASWAATITFMATAVAVTAIVHVATGGKI
jgi:uncharacterized protein